MEEDEDGKMKTGGLGFRVESWPAWRRVRFRSVVRMTDGTLVKGAAGVKRSAMWLYFQAENETTAKCGICKKLLRYSGNTANLYKHIKNHPKENMELQKRREEERNPPCLI